jgi:hypothetical protein
LRLTRWTLILLFLGALLAAFTILCEQAKVLMAFLSAVVIVVSIILNSIMNTRNPERIWYGARAVAESVKTLAWRYMAGAEPFPLTKPLREVEHEFADRLRKILDERKQLAFALASGQLSDSHITERMRSERGRPFQDRKTLYIDDRVLNQRDWYADKANVNRKRSQIYFAFTTVSQILAVIFALVLVAHPGARINAACLFTTLASALIAWMQLKQFSALAQSYAVTAIELGLIYEEGRHLANDDELAEFVADAENAISREHTL